LSDPEKLEEAIDAKIQDKELEEKAILEAEASAAKDEQLKRENDELRRTLEAARTAGFGGIASVGSGHNESSESKPAGYWSEAQRNELRNIYASRNMYSPEQISKMVQKAEEIAMTKTAQAARSNDLSKTRQY
jgi:hypothetical protein